MSYQSDMLKVLVENKQKIIIIAAVAVLTIAVGIGFWYWSKSKQEAPSLGDQLFEKTQNPLKGKLPETNPFKEQVNPFDTIYKNPFR